MKGGRKESLFPKNATHKGWKSPLIIVTMYKLWEKEACVQNRVQIHTRSVWWKITQRELAY